MDASISRRSFAIMMSYRSRHSFAMILIVSMALVSYMGNARRIIERRSSSSFEHIENRGQPQRRSSLKQLANYILPLDDDSRLMASVAFAANWPSYDRSQLAVSKPHRSQAIVASEIRVPASKEEEGEAAPEEDEEEETLVEWTDTNGDKIQFFLEADGSLTYMENEMKLQKVSKLRTDAPTSTGMMLYLKGISEGSWGGDRQTEIPRDQSYNAAKVIKLFEKCSKEELDEETEEEANFWAKERISMPPDSFQDLLTDAATSVDRAIAAGSLLIEVEFPSAPTSRLETSSMGAYDLLNLNLQWIVEFIKKLEFDKTTNLPRTVAITLVDAADRDIAEEFYGVKEPWQNSKLWSLKSGDAQNNPLVALGSLFKGVGEAVPAEWASMYIIVGCTAQDLTFIKQLAEKDPGKPIIFFNLKLDQLRGDLGIPGFPGRDTHHEFLSKVIPAYYLKGMPYSISITVPPFLVSYQGAIFRKYPEAYQTLLDRGRGSYRRVSTADERPNMGFLRAEVTDSLKFPDEKVRAAVTSSSKQQAYEKQITWWEKAEDEDVSKDWRK